MHQKRRRDAGADEVDGGRVTKVGFSSSGITREVLLERVLHVEQTRRGRLVVGGDQVRRSVQGNHASEGRISAIVGDDERKLGPTRSSQKHDSVGVQPELCRVLLKVPYGGPHVLCCRGKFVAWCHPVLEGSNRIAKRG